MNLDKATIRNLELIETPYEGRKNSLLDTIDNTLSPGGGRLLRSWILSPLKILKLIQDRQKAVIEIKSNPAVQSDLRTILKGLPDIERLAAKVGAMKAGPRDIVHLKIGLQKAEQLRKTVSSLKSVFIKENLKKMPDLNDPIELIEKAIVEEPPANLTDGGLFKKGYSDKLDILIGEIDEAKNYIYTLQQSEREKTGITSLKVGYTRVFGYYLEVTKPHLSKVPAHYVRKQTLVSAERFITEELKTKEELILNAEEKIREIEQTLYNEIITIISGKISDIQKAAEITSVFDVLSCFVVNLNEPGYCMPGLTDKMTITVKDGRHPVMEKLMPSGKYVPNDINVDGKVRRMAIITGPNMAGKSTYLRQVGLIVLLAHMGAPVPAKSAEIGICDRIFTRVGASDDLLRGRSTFMVEMTEAASILNNASDKSLILLDELGRGTSTYDGLAVAWSLVEYLNSVVGKRSRTLFATHYHELIELADKSDGIINLQVAVKQWQDSIVFLYKIMDGGCDDSYGVQVARLAGLPQRMLDRAREILTQLESNHTGLKGKFADDKPSSTYQISLFSAEENRLFNLFKSVDLDSVTPIEALNLLNKMKKVIDNEE
jgi:DNA mismatch repair protein MutS